MKNFCRVLTGIGSVLGAFILYIGVSEASSAPKEGAAAAIAMGCAVIPYCFARAVSEMSD